MYELSLINEWNNWSAFVMSITNFHCNYMYYLNAWSNLLYLFNSGFIQFFP